MRRDVRRIPAFFDSRLNCAAGASLGFAVIETILEWDRKPHRLFESYFVVLHITKWRSPFGGSCNTLVAE